MKSSKRVSISSSTGSLFSTPKKVKFDDRFVGEAEDAWSESLSTCAPDSATRSEFSDQSSGGLSSVPSSPAAQRRCGNTSQQSFRPSSSSSDGLFTSCSTTRFFDAANRTQWGDSERLPEAALQSTRASRARDLRPWAQRLEPPSPTACTPAAFFRGDFDKREQGLQALHDHSQEHGWQWEIVTQRPDYRKAKRGEMPATQASKNVVDRAGVFEGGRARNMRRKEVEGEHLAEDTGVHAVFRLKKRLFADVPDTALQQWRNAEYCARVEPHSRCFCGFTFIEHSAQARLGGGKGDGFAWKNSLGKKETRVISGPDFNDGHDGIPLMPCSKFRYMPSSPSQTSQIVSCADAFRAGRGASAEQLHHGWFAKCRNCNTGHQEHDPETEKCPLPWDEQVGNGRYQSSWECVVCNQRWEDHETAFEMEGDFQKKQMLSAKQRARGAAQHRGAPQTPEGLAWGERAAEIGRLLDENSYGLSGSHKDSDHYGHGWNYRNYKARIQHENALLREREAEIQRQRQAQGSDGITYVDTTAAYKEGKGAMYGFGVGEERLQYDNRGNPVLQRSGLTKFKSTGSLWLA
eukprot:TRINITY_DN26339_c0_g2_i1.p1 TRINITY_DN26339_c0_g2~~TRINITY_DN26339_c0_g2_i1.p1  ORF type:complete len:576 (+),score=47.38 TRINITY_DN26339_c0_g2_i1:94-1821(+)